MKCKRCGKESEDLRTLKLDYFWQIEDMEPWTYFMEGEEGATYFLPVYECEGMTVKTQELDRVTTNEHGIKTYHYREATEKVAPKEFVEHGGYQIRTCKDCRAEFLRMFESWLNA